MTPEQFRDLAIAAIERQIAAGVQLVWHHWGVTDVDGASLTCGCAITLAVQEADPAAALVVALSSSSPEQRFAAAATALGLTPEQVELFVGGFDDPTAFGEPSDDPWFLAGAAVAARFAPVATIESLVLGTMQALP